MGRRERGMGKRDRVGDRMRWGGAAERKREMERSRG